MTRVDPVQHHAGDQKTGDHEENIDPQEASRQAIEPCVIENNLQYCNSAQDLNVLAGFTMVREGVHGLGSEES